MTDYDKACRYQIKRDAPGFIHWLAGPSGTEFAFERWVDSRRQALPAEGDLTNDVVAQLRSRDHTVIRFLLIELMSRSRPDGVNRALAYVVRLIGEPEVASARAHRVWVGAAIINLTGPHQPDTVEMEEQFGSALAFKIGQRTLRDEPAADTLLAIEAAQATLWLLPWIPLMKGGNEPGIIDRWKTSAMQLPGEVPRSTLAALTCVLAELVKTRRLWEAALKEFNMKKSEFMEEIRAEGREEGREVGREEGREVGREVGAIEHARELLLRLGRKRLGRVGAGTRAAVAAVSDLERLDRLIDRLPEVASWQELLESP